MSDLMILRGDELKFDADLIAKTLAGMPGVSDIRRGDLIGSIIECEYTYRYSSTIVRLESDRDFISTDGVGDDSLRFALELQSRLNMPLRAYDDEYNFDINLSAVKTVEDFRGKM
jgi:hypothetical protein